MKRLLRPVVADVDLITPLETCPHEDRSQRGTGVPLSLAGTSVELEDQSGLLDDPKRAKQGQAAVITYPTLEVCAGGWCRLKRCTVTHTPDVGALGLS